MADDSRLCRQRPFVATYKRSSPPTTTSNDALPLITAPLTLPPALSISLPASPIPRLCSLLSPLHGTRSLQVLRGQTRPRNSRSTDNRPSRDRGEVHPRP